MAINGTALGAPRPLSALHKTRLDTSNLESDFYFVGGLRFLATSALFRALFPGATIVGVGVHSQIVQTNDVGRDSVSVCACLGVGLLLWLIIAQTAPLLSKAIVVLEWGRG